MFGGERLASRPASCFAVAAVFVAAFGFEAVFVAAALAGVFAAAAFAFAGDFAAVDLVVVLAAGAALAAAFAAAVAAASVRAVFDNAARALPAAVWAPLALSALEAAIRALAALAACAFDVVFVTRPPVWTWAPPVAALNFSVRRDLRRAAAFGWIAPTLAARSSAA